MPGAGRGAAREEMGEMGWASDSSDLSDLSGPSDRAPRSTGWGYLCGESSGRSMYGGSPSGEDVSPKGLPMGWCQSAQCLGALIGMMILPGRAGRGLPVLLVVGLLAVGYREDGEDSSLSGEIYRHTTSGEPGSGGLQLPAA